MNPVYIILLFVAGIVLIILETMIPGLVVGIVGGGLVIYSLVEAYSYGGMLFALSLFFVGLAILPFFIKKGFNKVKLKKTLNGKAIDSPDELMGKTGTLLTPLRPVGQALIEGKRLDVFPDHGDISVGQNVRVVRVDGSRIFVGVAEEKIRNE